MPVITLPFIKPTFTGIPREIRDHIYDELLVCPDPLYYCFDKLVQQDGPVDNFLLVGRPLNLTLGILSVNHKVYEEAREALYQRNRFSFFDSPDIDKCLDGMTVPNASLVRHLVLPLRTFYTSYHNHAHHLPVIDVLDRICHDCPDVVEIEMSIEGIFEIGVLGPNSDHDAMLAWIQAKLAAGLSRLRTLRVRHKSNNRAVLDLIDSMARHGWTVEAEKRKLAKYPSTYPLLLLF